MISPETYIILWSIPMLGYTLMMFLTPGKIVTDNFNYDPDSMTKFWIRGASPAWFMVLITMNFLVEPDVGVKIGTLMSLIMGILFPYNAKFGYFTGGSLPRKYPMHYFPEILMPTLLILGILTWTNMQ